MKIRVDTENAPPPRASVTALSPKTSSYINGGHSPNDINTSNSNNNNDRTDKDEIFQLQIEIQSLKNRLKLSSSAQKSELLELLAEKETVIQSKSKQISALNDKFHKITKAVAQMEKEVGVLRNDKDILEGDNKKLKRHLNIREKEVTALVTRCTVQEEKLAEGKSSRILEKQIKELQVKLLDSQQQLIQLDALQEKLVRNETERIAAITKVDALVMENKDLHGCIDDTKEQFQTKLDGRDESLLQMKLQMEALAGLKKEQDKKCDLLEENLKECDQQMKDMQGAIRDMKQEHDDAIVAMEKKMTEQSADAAKRQQETMDVFKIAKDNEIMELKKQLKVGDEAMVAVLKDVATLKNENEEVKKENEMVKKDLDVVQAEKKELLEDKQKDKEEKSSLSSLLDSKTHEIELLNHALRQLQDDNSNTVGEASKLSEHMRSLEDQIDKLTCREEALVTADHAAKQTIEELQEDLQDMEKVSSQIRLSNVHFCTFERMLILTLFALLF